MIAESYLASGRGLALRTVRDHLQRQEQVSLDPSLDGFDPGLSTGRALIELGYRAKDVAFRGMLAGGMVGGLGSWLITGLTGSLLGGVLGVALGTGIGAVSWLRSRQLHQQVDQLTQAASQAASERLEPGPLQHTFIDRRYQVGGVFRDVSALRGLENGELLQRRVEIGSPDTGSHVVVEEDCNSKTLRIRDARGEHHLQGELQLPLGDEPLYIKLADAGSQQVFSNGESQVDLRVISQGLDFGWAKAEVAPGSSPTVWGNGVVVSSTANRLSLFLLNPPIDPQALGVATGVGGETGKIGTTSSGWNYGYSHLSEQAPSVGRAAKVLGQSTYFELERPKFKLRYEPNDGRLRLQLSQGEQRDLTAEVSEDLRQLRYTSGGREVSQELLARGCVLRFLTDSARIDIIDDVDGLRARKFEGKGVVQEISVERTAAGYRVEGVEIEPLVSPDLMIEA